MWTILQCFNENEGQNIFRSNLFLVNKVRNFTNNNYHVENVIPVSNIQFRDHPFLRRWHFLGGKGSKICQRIVVKKLPTEGGRGQKSWKFADVLNGWSLRPKAVHPHCLKIFSYIVSKNYFSITIWNLVQTTLVI